MKEGLGVLLFPKEWDMGGLGSDTALNYSPFPLSVSSLFLFLCVHYSSFCVFHPSKVQGPVQVLGDLSFAKQGLLIQGRCKTEFESILEM